MRPTRVGDTVATVACASALSGWSVGSQSVCESVRNGPFTASILARAGSRIVNRITVCSRVLAFLECLREAPSLCHQEVES